MPSTNGPAISVGMPVYNGERYLQAAIESILDQSFEDFELVVSDNASTDATEEICRELADKDERIVYVRTPDNRGAMWNFNEVFRRSTGTFFKLACHDDLHDPVFLERCHQTFDEAPDDVVLVYPRSVMIDADGAVIGPYDDRLDLREGAAHLRLRGLLRNIRLVNALYGLHRRSAYASTALLGPYVASDTILLAELALRGQFWELPERLFLRRDHDGRSERAHRTHAELSQWYDPSGSGRPTGRRTKLMVEMVRAVGRAPLPAGERARCLAEVAREWGPRYGRVVGGEIKQQALSRIRR